ncbi:hypothetical protein [Nocardioides cynanchi]|uniref:hypothetical protein n=1 Tax=Nocardioides cynanchi TaxID=2558918 RepID=UPI001247B8CA|nr:hypothetical protein [Nocardioides cynanchi]
MSEPVARPRGRPYGFKPFHLVVGAVVACFWVGLAAFVLTHGRGDPSAVDVYSELPADFTAHLQAQGVQYQGLSSVDAATTQRVLSQPLGGGVTSTGSSAIVLRTALTDKGGSQGSTAYTDQAALMVVVPDVQSGGGSGSSVYVAFLDPVTFKILTSLTYDAAAPSSSG